MPAAPAGDGCGDTFTAAGEGAVGAWCDPETGLTTFNGDSGAAWADVSADTLE